MNNANEMMNRSLDTCAAQARNSYLLTLDLYSIAAVPTVGIEPLLRWARLLRKIGVLNALNRMFKFSAMPLNWDFPLTLFGSK